MSEEVTYMYTGGKYEFSQRMYDYDKFIGDGDGPPKDVTSVTFDTDVTKIGEAAFKDCTKLTTVAIPSSVTEIGVRAFYGCTELTTVTIPSSVTEIGSSVFRGCTKLATVAIPSSVTEIGEYAFYGCTELTTVAIPSSVTKIERSAFQGCTGLTTVAIPSSVTKIERSAFERCTGLTTVAIPSALTKIGTTVFYGCTSLSSVNLPSSVTSVGPSVFSNCPFLQKALDAQTKHGDMTEFIRHRFDDLPLHEFCHQSDDNASPGNIEEYLAKDKDATKKVDGFKMTPLHLLAASSIYNAKLFQFLLDHCPSSANKIDVYGNTPMHYLFINMSNGVTKEVMLKHTQAIVNVAPETLKHANADREVPLALAIRSEVNLEVREFLFAHYPIGAGFMSNEDEIHQLRKVAKQYIASLSSKKSLSSSRQNAWVTFVSSDNILSLSKKNELVEQVAHFVKECKDTSDVEVLAYAKDSYGRTAIEVAVPEIKIAMQKRLLFLGRYDIVKGPPIHKSATSVIVKAYDAIARDEYKLKYQAMKEHNVFTRDHLKKVLIEYGMRVDDELLDDMMKKYDIDSDKKLSEDEFVNFCKEEFDGGHKRTIVLKFFSNKTQFDREVDSRGQGNDTLDKKFVVQILEKYDLTEDKPLHKPPPDLHLEDYKYIVTMPYADRNLDTIFRSERKDELQTSNQAKEILQAISHLHENNIIHGDIKLLNIVRIQGRLSLIDFDASSRKTDDEDETYIGSKFSSGVIPPEMIVKLRTEKEFKMVPEYYKSDSEKDSEHWRKIKPKLNGEVAYMVKTYKTCATVKKRLDGSQYQVEEPLLQEKLPYKLENAAMAIDIWSYGTLLFTLLTGSSLFKVNRDDDLENKNEMAALYNWDEIAIGQKLEAITDVRARDLLHKLLQKDPDTRITAIESLQHPYFTRDNASESDEAWKRIEKNQEKMIEGLDLVMKSNMRVEASTMNLIKASEDMKLFLKSSTSTLCKAVFEATEVKTPTCFIIVPYKIPFPSINTPEKYTMEKVTEYAEDLLSFVDTYSKWDCSLLEKFASSLKQKFQNTMYLYLVDEYTGEAVDDPDRIYPIEIQTHTKEFTKILPVMAMGVVAIKLLHKGVGLAKMFYPCLPNVPDILIKKADEFVGKDDSYIHQLKGEKHSQNWTKVRGSALREFVALLKEKDAKMKFCGLRKVCNEGSGDAIWVTNDSADKVEGNENNILAPERKDFEAKIKELEEELKAKKEDAQIQAVPCANCYDSTDEVKGNENNTHELERKNLKAKINELEEELKTKIEDKQTKAGASADEVKGNENNTHELERRAFEKKIKEPQTHAGVPNETGVGSKEKKKKKRKGGCGKFWKKKEKV